MKLLFGSGHVCLLGLVFGGSAILLNAQGPFPSSPDPLFGSTGAQRTSIEFATVRGEISGSVDASNVRVQMRSLGGNSLQADVQPNGSFEFNGVPAGSYELDVIDFSGNVLHREFVTAGDGMSLLMIRVDAQEVKSAKPASGVISVRRLQHRVPEKAIKEMKLAEKAHKKGDSGAVFAHVQKAVAIDPECVECLNNLGARYFDRKQPDKALEQFTKALKIDPSALQIQTNVTIALLMLNKPGDAELAARRAIELDGTSMKARYLLALSLIGQEKFSDEALKNLNMAAGQFPKAHLAAAQVLESMGKLEVARAELQQYMDSRQASPELKEQAQAWMARITPAAAHQ